MTILGPTWVYHADQPARLIRSQGEYDRLGPGWCDSPQTAPTPPDPIVVKRGPGRPRKERHGDSTDAH
jgi:hypothetical protein